VARIDALSGLDSVADLLQEFDRSRLRRIVSEKRRRELLAGRWLLQALSTHLGLSPVVFDGAEGAAGVVVRASTQADLRLSASLTHAGQWVACALGWEDGVGIDLEILVERDFVALTEASLAGAVDAIRALAPEERKVAFYQRWTQHEAAIKRGVGVGVGRETSWMLPGQWVLSLNWSSSAAFPAHPLIWDESAHTFRSLCAEALRV
jgi:phosphopantetheinyl transferase